MEFIREHWDCTSYNELINYLRSLANNDLKEKTQKLIPDTPNMLGIPMATLKEIGLKIAKGNGKEFLDIAKSDCYEETIIEAYVIGNIKLQYDEFLSYVKYYAEKANSWAICDMTIHFKQIRSYQEEFWQDVDYFLTSENVWLQRIGIIIMLKFYINDSYIDKVLQKLSRINSRHYYVNLAEAWLLSYAYTKYQKQILDFLSNNYLNEEVCKMTIKKMRELKSISSDDKNIVIGLIGK